MTKPLRPLPVSPKEIADYLEEYNRWRRGADDIEHPVPVELGVVLERAINILNKSKT